jgi:hypothetical protein
MSCFRNLLNKVVKGKILKEILLNSPIKSQLDPTRIINRQFIMVTNSQYYYHKTKCNIGENETNSGWNKNVFYFITSDNLSQFMIFGNGYHVVDFDDNDDVYVKSDSFQTKHIIIGEKILFTDVTDIDVCLDMFSSNNDDYATYFSNRVFNNEEFALKAVARSGDKLRYFSDEIRDNDNITLIAIKNDGRAFEYCSDRIRSKEDNALIAIKTYAKSYLYCSDEIKKSKQFAINAVTCYIGTFEYMSHEFRNDKDIAMIVATTYPFVTYHCSDELKNDEDIALQSVSKIGHSLKHFSDEIKNNKKVVLAAVKNTPDVFDCCSDELKNDEEVLTASRETYFHNYKGCECYYCKNYYSCNKKFIYRRTYN